MSWCLDATNRMRTKLHLGDWVAWNCNKEWWCVQMTKACGYDLCHIGTQCEKHVVSSMSRCEPKFDRMLRCFLNMILDFAFMFGWGNAEFWNLWRIRIGKDRNWNDAYLKCATMLPNLWGVLFWVPSRAVKDDFEVYADLFLYFVVAVRWYIGWDSKAWLLGRIQVDQSENWNSVCWKFANVLVFV